MFSITSRKISTGSKFELTKGPFYMQGCPFLPPRGVKMITTLSIRKVNKREYLPMYIDTASACQEYISVVTVTTTRSFKGGGGGWTWQWAEFSLCFMFSSRAFQTRVLSSFSIKKCWEKEQLEQPELAGKQLFEQFPVIWLAWSTCHPWADW